MKKISIILVLIVFVGTMCAQNVGINATGAVPHSSAGLDVNFTDKGFLIPRVALTALNSASPVSSPTVSLLVYNTATAGSSPNNVVPGYYYWDGSVWVAISGHGSKNWSLLGNAGTTAGTNFIGTTDAIDWVVKTNNAESMRVLSSGEVGIGTIPGAKLHVASKNSTAALFQCSNLDTDVLMEIKTSASARRGTVDYLFDIGINAASAYGELQPYTSSGAFLNTILNKNGGNVGIGTFGPSDQLEITKNFRIPVTTGSTVGVINSGSSRFIHNYGSLNTFMGVNAGNFTLSGNQNVGIGGEVLASNTTGYANTAIGYGALSLNTTGEHNTALGYSALTVNTTGNQNTAIGFRALHGNSTGYQNTASGYLSLFSNTGGVCNTANGMNALYSNTTGGNNTAEGFSCLHLNTIGSNNTAQGREAMYSNVNGSQNTASGYLAMYSNVDGTYNTASGYQALKLNVSGTLNSAFGVEALYSNTASFNTAIGRQALYYNTSGTENTSAGVYSLFYNTSGSYNAAWGNGALISVNGASNNTGLGYGTDVSGGGGNATAIGSGAVSNAADKIRLGNAAVTVVEGPVGYTVSDGRFKSNISETDVKGLEFIKRLRPVVYNFNAQQFQEFLTYHLPDSIKQKHFNGINYDKATAIRQSGFIAQEVEQAMKESGYNFNGVHVPENEHDNYSLAYGQFVVPIIKSIQEQQQTIEQQQLVINALKEKNKHLESTVSKVEEENKTIKANYDKRLKALEELMGVRAQK